MTQQIWLVSYIIPERLEPFKRALQSFADQTVKCSVNISLCGPSAKDARQIVFDILDNPLVMTHNERYSQFDQLFLLHKHLRPDPNIWISFCDDDDYYTSDRIEIQQNYIDKIENKYDSIECGAGGQFAHRDFGCLCVRADTLEHFFTNPEGLNRAVEVIAPDIFFRACRRSLIIKEILYIRENLSESRTYNQKRSGSDSGYWFTPKLFQ